MALHLASQMLPVMRRLRWAIAAHSATTFAATTAFKVIASYNAIDLGFAPAELGLLAASFGVPPVLIAFHAGRWTDVVGGLRAMLIGDVIILLAALVPIFVPGSVALLLAAATMGIGTLLSIVGQQALIAAAIAKEDQERVFGTMFSANAIGQMAGPLAVTVLGSYFAGAGESLSVETGLSAAVALAAAGLAALLVFPRGSWSQHRDAGVAPVSAFRAIGSIVAVKGAVPILCYNAVVAAVIDMLSIFLPAWGVERQIAPAAVGALLAVRSASSIVVRFSMLPIVSLLGRRNVLVGSAALTAVSLAGMPFADICLALAFAIALGLALGLAPPISLAWFSIAMPPGLRGSAMGLRILANRVAQAGVPAAVGLVSAGVAGMFITTAVLVAATSVLAIRVPFARRDGT